MDYSDKNAWVRLADMIRSDWIVPINFIYGLAFFTLGLVVLMESIRDAESIEKPKLFRLLGFFALLHAFHEWLDILPAQGQGGVIDPALLEWIRSGSLALSFSMLWLYGLGTYRAASPNSTFFARFGRCTLPAYAALVILDVAFAFAAGKIDMLQAFSGLTRYLLAVPSAALAAIGIRATASRATRNGSSQLASFQNRLALLFVGYSLTQFFVPPMNTILAGLFSSSLFATWIGIPIQSIRAVIALGMTWYLFREVLYLEKKRKDEKERAQAERLEALEVAEKFRGELLRHTIKAQEDERARVSRELHDEVSQVLTALSFELGTLKTFMPRGGHAEPVLLRLQSLTRSLSRGLYDIVRSLRPAQLDELGLEPALHSLAEREWNPRGIHIRIESEGKSVRLAKSTETTLFRIAQEGVTNIQRHSGADSATLRIHYAEDKVTLTVKDDGIGFDPERLRSGSQGLGLAGIRERVESSGGTFRIDSAPGRGTLLEIIIPTSAEKGET